MCLCEIVYVRVCMLSLAEHIDYIIYALSCSKIVFRNLNGKWDRLFYSFAEAKPRESYGNHYVFLFIQPLPVVLSEEKEKNPSRSPKIKSCFSLKLCSLSILLGT